MMNSICSAEDSLMSGGSQPSMRYYNIRDTVKHEVHANERLEQVNVKDEMRSIWKRQQELLKAETIIP